MPEEEIGPAPEVRLYQDNKNKSEEERAREIKEMLKKRKEILAAYGISYEKEENSKDESYEKEEDAPRRSR